MSAFEHKAVIPDPGFQGPLMTLNGHTWTVGHPILLPNCKLRYPLVSLIIGQGSERLPLSGVKLPQRGHGPNDANDPWQTSGE